MRALRHNKGLRAVIATLTTLSWQVLPAFADNSRIRQAQAAREAELAKRAGGKTQTPDAALRRKIARHAVQEHRQPHVRSLSAREMAALSGRGPSATLTSLARCPGSGLCAM